MRFFERLLARWPRPKAGVELAREIDEEFRFHLELRTEDNVRDGLAPADARRDAEARFGDFGHYSRVGRRILRARRRNSVVGATAAGVLQDVSYGFRVLRRSPAVSALAVLVLAIGIGANTAIFSVVNAVLLRPLPYAASERLVQVWSEWPGNRWNQVEAPDFPAYAAAPSLEYASASQGPNRWLLESDTRREFVRVTSVSPDMFDLLGASFELGGRLPAEPFTVELDGEGRNLAVVLTHEFWERQFGADPEIVGHTIKLHNPSRGWPFRQYTVVGVLAPGFRLPPATFSEAFRAYETDCFVPFSQAWYSAEYGGQGFRVVARMRQGLTVEQTQAGLDAIAARIVRDNGDVPPAYRVRVARIADMRHQFYGQSLGLLQGAVGVVLLIVCLNVASLLLARAAWRQGEFALRASLGASRVRIARQLIIEHLLLAGFGGLAGLMIAFATTAPLARLLPPDIVGLDTVVVDARVLAFALSLSGVTVLLFGAVPVLRLSRASFRETIKAAGVSTASRHRLLRGTVVSQVALSCVLLVGAGLFLNSLVRLVSVDPGVQHENVLTVSLRRIPPSASKYGPGAAEYREGVHPLHGEILRRIRAIPGVLSAAATERPPFYPTPRNVPITVPGSPLPPEDQERPVADFRWVSNGYFRAMGIPVLAGREFTPEDDQWSAPWVAVVNETLARVYWPGEDPIGKTLHWGHNDLQKGEFDWRFPSSVTPHTIVGVVGDVRSVGLDEPSPPQAYYPWRDGGAAPVFVIRARDSQTAVTAAVRAAIAGVDESEFPIASIGTLAEDRAALLAEPRLYAVVLILFAAAALLLALVGLYGVVSYLVGWRRHEIGVRMAIGAGEAEVLRLFLRQGMVLVALGVALGVAGAVALSRLLRAHLFEVSPTDPVTFFIVVTLVSVVALAASYFPARRAALVDPVEALRVE